MCVRYIIVNGVLNRSMVTYSVYIVSYSVKDCKYFKSGRGKCPFGNKCFYLHAYPDGTKADVGPPVRHRRHSAELDVLQVSSLCGRDPERYSF
jgi:hypothetical protein